MRPSTGLRASLKRGALLAAANWQVVLAQFAAETTFKILLAIPLVGGALIVAVLLGADLQDLLAGGWRQLVASIIGALLSQPLALSAFLFAFLVVLVGGSAFMFLMKGGVVATMVASEALTGAIEQPPLRLAAFWRASQFGIELFVDACGRLFPRYLRLGFLLLAVYGLSGVLYVALLVSSYQVLGRTGLSVEWTVLAALGSTLLIAWITGVNLLYLLTQMIIAVDDRPIGGALRQVGRFLRARPLEVTVVFGSVLGLVVIATVASMVAATGLGLISFVPLVGLAVLPLQVAAWLLRGLVFQYLGLTALGAYLALYRPVSDRFDRSLTDLRSRPRPPFVRTA
jgi:hypothetical protein